MVDSQDHTSRRIRFHETAVPSDRQIVDLSTPSRHADAADLFKRYIHRLHSTIDSLDASRTFRQTAQQSVELWNEIYDGTELVTAIHVAHG